jgi:acyl-CoA thioester hydrolase
LRVYYEDTDAGGIVYYANYLKFAERARSEFLRAAGIDQTAMRENDGLIFAVRRVEVDYREPARLDDAIEVRSRLLEVGGASVVAEQVVEKAGRRLVRVVVKVACITLDEGRPARIPAAIRGTLAPYCGHNQQAE